MKKQLLLFLFILVCNALCSQDLIVIDNTISNNEDSLKSQTSRPIPFDSIEVFLESNKVQVIPFDSIDVVSNNVVIIDNSSQTAKLHFYRPSGVGAFVGYDIHLDDEVICRTKNNWKTTVDVPCGAHTIWAKTESKSEVPIKITAGNEYYIRCGVKMGIMVGRPVLELVDSSIGSVEYQSVKEKKSKK